MRAISERHKAGGIFPVYVIGWGEFQRKFTRYDALVRKRYPAIFGLGAPEREKIDAFDSRTAVMASQMALLVSDRAPATEPPAAGAITEQFSLNAVGITEALERDLERRYRRALQRMSFPEVAKNDEFAALAADVLDGAAKAASAPLRRRILLRAARAAALRGRLSRLGRSLLRLHGRVAQYGLLLAALGACTGTTIRMYANRKGLRLNRVVWNCATCSARPEETPERAASSAA